MLLPPLRRVGRTLHRENALEHPRGRVVRKSLTRFVGRGLQRCRYVFVRLVEAWRTRQRAAREIKRRGLFSGIHLYAIDSPIYM